MAAESTKTELGTKATDFTLFDTVSGEKLSLDELKSEKATVIMFICNHCPYVVRINEGISEFAFDYIPKGVSVIAISANDAENYPDDSPEKMKENAKKNNFNFPYLYDETQEIASAYDAQCTPDIYVYDKDMKLVYRGQFDDARPSNDVEVTGKDLRNAVDCLLEGKANDKKQIPSIGCSIKWK